MRLVIWGESAGRAEFVRQALGLGVRDVVCVGPRNPGILHGLARIDGVLILPDARDNGDQEVAQNLAVIGASSPFPILDLRD